MGWYQKLFAGRNRIKQEQVLSLFRIKQFLWHIDLMTGIQNRQITIKKLIHNSLNHLRQQCQSGNKS
jgi:hypothetical protein